MVMPTYSEQKANVEPHPHGYHSNSWSTDDHDGNSVRENVKTHPDIFTLKDTPTFTTSIHVVHRYGTYS